MPVEVLPARQKGVPSRAPHAGSGDHPLRTPLFRNLWLATLASGIGTTMHDTAAAWTLASSGASPQIVALYQTMASLPLFLFALPAGAIADLSDRRRLILGTQIIGALVAAGVAGAAAFDHVSATLLLGAAFALGILFAFSNPAWQSLVPEIVSRAQMPQAVTLGSVGVNVARSIGPVAGGLLLSLAGPAWVFGANAVSYLLLAGVLITWRRQAPVRPVHGEHFMGAMIAAVRYTRHEPGFRAVLARGAVFVACAIAAPVLLPIVARERHLSASVFGALFGAYGIGAILTAVVILPQLRQRWRTDALLAAFTLLSAGSLAGFAFAPTVWWMAACLLGAGAAWVGNFSSFNVATQAILPNWVRARGSAIQLLVMQAALAVGALVWGEVAAAHGVSAALWSAGAMVVLGLLLTQLFPLNAAATADLSPSAHWAPHSFPTEPAEDAGPVLVSLDYSIPAENTEAFRAAMRHLRRVRLRDGAFRWSLWQDAAETGHFRESFLVASWGEHLRQHDRATVDDRRVEEAALAFHAAPEPPRISHFLSDSAKPLAASGAAMAAAASTRSV